MTPRTILRRGLLVATPMMLAALISACGSSGSSSGDGSSDDRNASPVPSLQLREGSPADVGALIGLSEADAEAEAEANGWTVRVVERDGEEYMVTMDYSDSRVNLTIEDGVVTNATIG